MDSVLYFFLAAIKIFVLLLGIVLILSLIHSVIKVTIRELKYKTVGTFFIKTKCGLDDDIFSLEFDVNPKDFINEKYVLIKIESDLGEN